ncbi:MAG: hypothetical protein EBQ71_16810 [Betaproteobacteria bacterium]|nr:hypothetical protein [Betaproteobacteria bacterium]
MIAMTDRLDFAPPAQPGKLRAGLGTAGPCSASGGIEPGRAVETTEPRLQRGGRTLGGSTA